MAVSIDDQIACVEREIRMREQVYPRWIAQRKLTQPTADKQIAGMKAVLDTLQTVKAATPPAQAGLGLE